MNQKLTNRRVQYTRLALKKSFIDLLGQKDITKITVKELCESADINRTTFYLHFKDPYDLLEQVELELIEGINTYLDTCDFTNPSEFPLESLTKILEYVRENKKLCHILLNKNNDQVFQNKILTIIGNQYFLSEPRSTFPKLKNGDYIFTFFASGALGIIKKWLSEDALIPAEDISGMIIHISVFGSSSLANEKKTENLIFRPDTV